MQMLRSQLYEIELKSNGNIEAVNENRMGLTNSKLCDAAL
jgi:hypothetical protein